MRKLTALRYKYNKKARNWNSGSEKSKISPALISEYNKKPAGRNKLVD
jgi:hypothetical protein